MMMWYDDRHAVDQHSQISHRAIMIWLHKQHIHKHNTNTNTTQTHTHTHTHTTQNIKRNAVARIVHEIEAPTNKQINKQTNQQTNKSTNKLRKKQI